MGFWIEGAGDGRHPNAEPTADETGTAMVVTAHKVETWIEPAIRTGIASVLAFSTTALRQVFSTGHGCSSTADFHQRRQ